MKLVLVLIDDGERMTPLFFKRFLAEGEMLIHEKRSFVDVQNGNRNDKRSGNGNGGRNGIDHDFIKGLLLVVERTVDAECAVGGNGEERRD